jgi:hypothetical protein
MNEHTNDYLKIYLISICGSGMPIICRAKKPTFQNMDSLVAHHINGSRPSTFPHGIYETKTIQLWKDLK